PSEWVGRDEGSPGYWTGTASMPRAAQHENVGIYIYSPAYPDGGTLGFFDYEPMTHAYFPRDRFDEVEREGKWIVARKGKALIGLYSWRPTEWQEYPDAELALPAERFRHSFDLVAPGGPDNVWIVEWARTKDYPFYGAFLKSFQLTLAEAKVEVTPRKTEFGHQ